MANEKRLIDGNGRYTLHASDNTDYSLLFRNGIICVENELGHCVCEFLADDAPTVDAVEVVRCKDCKHKTVTSDGMVCECALPTKTMKDYYIYGSTILARVEPDAFCSYGERREGE